ncbi:sodium:solute symporter family transporter [Streptomyces vietnamensis]|uniref:sodium:solute symporter family transporter n=1 Tax=Streptomyces vietnamensis TaxID=362257 RepID=UPI000698A310|nr:transporter [Streptomyces vietnamensis]
MTLRTFISDTFSGEGVIVPIGSDARGPVIVAFLVCVGLSMLWLFTLSAGQEDHPERLYIADRSLSPVFNGVALAGEWLSIATLLTIPATVTLYGYDGISFGVQIMMSMGVMLLLAQRIRNSGRYTLGGLFSLRASGAAPRIAAAVVTLVIAIPVLLIQLRAAGLSAALLIGMSTPGAQVVCTVLMGVLVACFASVADLRGISVIQMVKVPLTILVLAAITLLALARFGWNPERLLASAARGSSDPDRYMAPGMWVYTTSVAGLDRFGDNIVEVLGMAVLPPLVLRVAASRSGRSARRSMSIAAGLGGVIVFLLIAAGFATAAMLEGLDVTAIDGNGQSAVILMAADLFPYGSTVRVVLITVMACVTFLAVLSTVTSATFAAAVSTVHDGLAHGRRIDAETKEAWLLRPVIIALCVLALTMSAALHEFPIDFLIIIVVNLSASAVFPALVYSLFWRTFNRRGLLWSVYGGLLSCLALTIASPPISGNSFALFPDADFNWYPLQTTGLISVPAAFLLGWLGSRNGQGNSEHDSPHIEHLILTGREAEPKAEAPRE